MLFLLFMTHWIQIYEKLTQPILLEIFWRSFWKKNILSENRFSPIYDVIKVWILLILPKNVFFCSFWPIKSKYMKNWSSLSCWKFSEDYFEKKNCEKNNDFHQFMTSWRCEICWGHQKMRFFALFDPFNPNIWKINSAYLVANFLKIILDFFLPKNRFSPIYDVIKVWILLISTKK